MRGYGLDGDEYKINTSLDDWSNLCIMLDMVNEITINKSGDTRQHVLDVAKEIILGKGFAAVGLNEILTSAGVPKGSFYHYFKSKEQFGDELIKDYFEQYMQQLELTLSPGSASSLLAYFQAWLDTQSSDTTADKCLVVKLSAEVTDLSELMRITLKNGTDRVIARLAECVEDGIRKGEFPAHLDAKSIAAEIYYTWVGATLLTKVSHTREPLERAMDATKARLGLA
jgi:TetR/AcrR family transcriptional repressor of nem operon